MRKKSKVVFLECTSSRYDEQSRLFNSIARAKRSSNESASVDRGAMLMHNEVIFRYILTVNKVFDAMSFLEVNHFLLDFEDCFIF